MYRKTARSQARLGPGGSAKNLQLYQILYKKSIWQCILCPKEYREMCVFGNLGSEYYQSWSVKGIPGIVRDKGTLILIDRLLIGTQAQTFTSLIFNLKPNKSWKVTRMEIFIIW